MNLIIFVFFVFIGVNCEPAKQSSELNFVVAKPVSHEILPEFNHSPTVNLVKYGQFSGYPIHALPFGKNKGYSEYVKPVLNYEHQKHYQPPLSLELPPLPIFEAKKYANHHPTNELPIARTKYNQPILINANYHHVKENPFFETSTFSTYPATTGFDPYISEHLNRNYLPLNNLNPAVYPHHPANAHHINSQHVNNHDLHSLSFVNDLNSHPSSYPSSYIKFDSPLTTSYFVKINHVVPEHKGYVKPVLNYEHQKYQGITARTEFPFFEHKLEHKLEHKPSHYANQLPATHYGYAPNFVNHHSNIKN